MKYLGIDASRYQGVAGMSFKRFDALNSAGVRFGIFRATIGTLYDTSCPVNIERASKLGWVTGTYHFLTPGDAIAQAEHYVKACGDGLAVLDVEQSGVSGPLVRAFVKRFRELRPKQPIGCYTSEGAWKHLTGNMDGEGLFDYLWQARWTELGTNEKRDLPDSPPAAGFGGWKSAALWQYGAFHVQGFDSLDGDAWYGSLEDLAAQGRKVRPPLTERPKYAAGYNAMVDEVARLARVTRDPDTDSGAAWDAGVNAGRADAIAALTATRLGG